MDFIKGGDLKKLIQDSGAFTEDMVKFYTCIISMTLGYLHAHDIIYRNLILDNIML
jgi:protein kinase A